jgi:hydroquinone 1,2-dioxygenase/2,6-dichloro-p-hydroquinone 1,2-dioxygenase/glyoxalase family protein
MADRIQGLHHITLCTGTAQGDANFFVKILGMNLVKRTLLYDGKEPVYHLYFSDATGSPGNLTTCFPWRRTGRKARAGSGQITLTSYTVPVDSLEFWTEHLTKKGVNILEHYERFGQKVLKMEHPDCPALHFELIEDASDTRLPFKSKYVPEKYALRGFHSWTVTARDLEDMHFFLNEGWDHKKTGTDGAFTRYEVAGGGGTEFDCIFEYLKEEQIEPKRLVVFTDGYPYGSWGDEHYADTVWILHGTTTIVPPWGQYAYYEEERK